MGWYWLLYVMEDCRKNEDPTATPRPIDPVMVYGMYLKLRGGVT